MKHKGKIAGFGLAVIGATALFFTGGKSPQSAAQKPAAAKSDLSRPDITPLPTWAETMQNAPATQKLLAKFGTVQFAPVLNDKNRIVAPLHTKDGRDLVVEVEHIENQLVVSTWALHTQSEELKILSQKLADCAPEELGRLVAEINGKTISGYKKPESVEGAASDSVFDIMGSTVTLSFESWQRSKAGDLPDAINYLPDGSRTEIFVGTGAEQRIGLRTRNPEGKEIYQIIFAGDTPIAVRYDPDLTSAESCKQFFGGDGRYAGTALTPQQGLLVREKSREK